MSVTYHAESGPDWVEIAGVARKPMRVLLAMENDFQAGYEFAKSVTVDGAFYGEDGAPVDWRADFYAITLQQWDWWRARIWKAAREEVIDPNP